MVTPMSDEHMWRIRHNHGGPAPLAEATRQIHTPSNLLSVCGWCKKIRDDQGRWHEIENDFKERTEAEFTHGICPPCAKLYFPEIAARRPKSAKTPFKGQGSASRIAAAVEEQAAKTSWDMAISAEHTQIKDKDME